VLRGFGAATAGAPDELTDGGQLTTAPPAPFLPAEVHGKPIVAVAALCGRAAPRTATPRRGRSASWPRW
jgi:hypothetical protein